MPVTEAVMPEGVCWPAPGEVPQATSRGQGLCPAALCRAGERAGRHGAVVIRVDEGSRTGRQSGNSFGEMCLELCE